MKNLLWLSHFVAIISPLTALADYKPDWNFKNFYEEVSTCRTAVVFPSGQEYEKSGLKAGRSKESLRGELIATTPVFEEVATAGCYCALNELAKDMSNAEFKKDPDNLGPYLETPRCKTKITETTNALHDKEKTMLLKLQ